MGHPSFAKARLVLLAEMRVLLEVGTSWEIPLGSYSLTHR